jgi:hypothetical protein
VNLTDPRVEASLQVAVTAKMYIDQALHNMNAKKVPDVVTKWFGRNSDELRQRVQSILQGTKRVMQNPHLIFPPDGPQLCDDTTLAFVDGPPADRTSNGDYVINLCNIFLEGSLSEQIETMTHEGSHHLPMDLLDVEYKGETAYGQELCLALAADCSREQPPGQLCTNAANNADNFAFFINEAFKIGQPSDPERS